MCLLDESDHVSCVCRRKSHENIVPLYPPRKFLVKQDLKFSFTDNSKELKDLLTLKVTGRYQRTKPQTISSSSLVFVNSIETLRLPFLSVSKQFPLQISPILGLFSLDNSYIKKFICKTKIVLIKSII